MLRYPIDFSSQLDWYVFAEEKTGYTYSCAPNVCNILLAVKRVFEDTFGKEAVDSHNRLYVVHGEGFPTTYRENEIIFLSATEAHYLYYIFQFAHELLHFMAPHNTCGPYLWLEETLCQMMSVHALKTIQRQGETNPLYELENLYTEIDGYIPEISPTVKLQGRSFQKFFGDVLPEITVDGCKREINNTIGKHLYPLFLEEPRLWGIIEHLHILQGNETLRGAFHKLICAVGLPENLASRLTSVFYDDSSIVL